METCKICNDAMEIAGEVAGNFHDCPNDCIPGKDFCKLCNGLGYIAPPVACECLDKKAHRARRV